MNSTRAHQTSCLYIGLDAVAAPRCRVGGTTCGGNRRSPQAPPNTVRRQRTSRCFRACPAANFGPRGPPSPPSLAASGRDAEVGLIGQQGSTFNSQIPALGSCLHRNSTSNHLVWNKQRNHSNSPLIGQAEEQAFGTFNAMGILPTSTDKCQFPL